MQLPSAHKNKQIPSFISSLDATQTPVKTHTHTHWKCSRDRPDSLLHGCSERRHPSRDQQTAVNPLLKILANPLGLLRIASGHCVWHKSGITQGAPTPDPLSRHVRGAKVQLSSAVQFTELGQLPPNVAGRKVLIFRCLRETKKDREYIPNSKQPLRI